MAGFTSASIHAGMTRSAMLLSRALLNIVLSSMSRVRYRVECPKCHTRYLPGSTPYRNGSYLLPLVEGLADDWTLYCSCGRPHSSSRYNCNELKRYSISTRAYERGYGPPEEIVPVNG